MPGPSGNRTLTGGVPSGFANHYTTAPQTKERELDDAFREYYVNIIVSLDTEYAWLRCVTYLHPFVDHVVPVIDRVPQQLFQLQLTVHLFQLLILRHLNLIIRVQTLTMFEATACGRSWVQSPTGAIVGWVFHATQVTGTVFSHLNMPFLPNSEFI